MTTDLFGAPALQGLSTQADLIDADEERMLMDRIDATDLTPFRFQGWTGKRLTTSFGWSYDFERAARRRLRRSPTGCARSAIGRPDLRISIPRI